MRRRGQGLPRLALAGSLLQVCQLALAMALEARNGSRRKSSAASSSPEKRTASRSRCSRTRCGAEVDGPWNEAPGGELIVCCFPTGREDTTPRRGMQAADPMWRAVACG